MREGLRVAVDGFSVAGGPGAGLDFASAILMWRSNEAPVLDVMEPLLRSGPSSVNEDWCFSLWSCEVNGLLCVK